MRRPSVAIVLLLVACTDSTPPIRDPVVHDLTVVTTSFTGDFEPDGSKKTYSRNDTSVKTLIIDLHTWGARFDPEGPCGVTEGRVGVGAESMHGNFEPVFEGGPTFSLAGTKDSTGFLAGTWSCRTRTLGPHYYAYSGTFRLKRRP